MDPSVYLQGQIALTHKYARCADDGKVAAAYYAGKNFLEVADTAAALVIFAEKTNMGDQSGNFQLRQRAKNNYEHALHYLAKSANAGNLDGTEALAEVYRKGKEDWIKAAPYVALELYSRAVAIATRQGDRLRAVRIYGEMKTLEPSHPLTLSVERSLYGPRRVPSRDAIPSAK
jgi:hypothetical protein